MEVTIGGNRVGSGKKMKAHLHNYERSTHNLSEKWQSSAGVGILYPCLCKIAMRGDSFDINIDADARTVPAVGAMFGKFKMQIDVYQCPIRLYQALLHNNPQAIGMKMNQIKLPKLVVNTAASQGDLKAGKFSDNCLLTYLGMRGLGTFANVKTASANGGIARQINALPALSYYDIFKTYYANKQEEEAYVIQGRKKYRMTLMGTYYDGMELQYWANIEYPGFQGKQLVLDSLAVGGSTELQFNSDEYQMSPEEIARIKDLETTIIYDTADEWEKTGNIYQILNDCVGLKTVVTAVLDRQGKTLRYVIKITKEIAEPTYNNMKLIAINVPKYYNTYADQLNLTPFYLQKIDDMRYDLLSYHTMGSSFIIEEDTAYLPYATLVQRDNELNSMNKLPLNGLVVKTYQNDIFNNWLNTEWIEGENGINELSKVAIVDGAFSMDSLNFATKLYNMLNRIAVAGATYEDWQDVVYEQIKHRQIESPVFCGGMSKIITFDEIVQTAPAEVAGEATELGTLGGRGRADGQSQKGGRLHIKCDEACFIMGIVSLTPLISQTQGNEFYMTELDSLDDLHKPAMDGIGFQDLIGERMAWFDTLLNENTPTEAGILHRSKIGKLPAWIEYMTSVDKAYGDFAADGGYGYMILNRDYQQDEGTLGIADATTYIDPSKYNYAFAYKDIDAQNFWLQINWSITARRKMSARLIPNV